MIDVVTLGERKGTVKCELRMLFSAIPKKMPLSGKEHGEIVKIHYLNEQNATQTLRVYRRNHGLRRGPTTVKAGRDLIHKFEETGCICDRPRSGWPSVPMKTVVELLQTISTVCPSSVCGVSRILSLPNSTVPLRFKRVQMFEARKNQLRLDFANEFLIRYDEDSSWPLRILWTDETHFKLTGNLN